MRALSATELLNVWERGLAQSPAQRALTLLNASCADVPLERLARCSAAERDRRLLTLRERTFGSQLASIASCPACGERLEFGLDAAELGAAPVGETDEVFTVAHGDCEVRFRLPDSLDLASLDPAAGDEVNRRRLLQRCVIEARRGGGEAVEAGELSAETVVAVARRMAEVDPQADLQLALSCPACQHAWEAPLDIVSYFWSEIHAWATRLLREIHLFASAYGWREADVLALSPRRRQFYLEMIAP